MNPDILDENRISLEGVALWLACTNIKDANNKYNKYTTAQIYDTYIEAARQYILSLLKTTGREDN